MCFGARTQQPEYRPVHLTLPRTVPGGTPPVSASSRQPLLLANLSATIDTRNSYNILQPSICCPLTVPRGFVMPRVQSATLLTLCLTLTAPLPKAAAESVVVEAGKTHTLTADLVLNGDDVLDIRGTPEKPCVLVGNRHRIRSGPKWTGSIRITHCTIRDLGGLPK